ncbi:MAG TPA: hypothetical protein VG711_02890, partial [Phycisphaerales bacterium]|nr:hypothetical protein [Phycisphaerales bacterium]
MIRRLLSVLTISSVTAAGFAQHSIDQLAPDNSIAVLSVKSVSKMQDRLKNTGLWALWESDQTKDMLKQYMKKMNMTEEDMEKHLTETLNELGLEKDDVVYPTGHIGISFSPHVGDDADDSPAMLDMLMVADFGENAEKADKMFQALVEKGEKEKLFTMEDKDAAGRKIHTLEIIEPAEDEQAKPKENNGGDEEEEWEGDEDWDSPKEPKFPYKNINYVREGSMYLISSDMELLAGALDSIDGKPHKSMMDSAGYQRLSS